MYDYRFSRSGIQPEPEEITEEMENECTCKEYDWGEHSCPFGEDVWNGSDSLCTCCPYCEQQCSDNI